MRHLKMVKEYEGCKEGDVVAFEDLDEARALVKGGAGVEVRNVEGEWVPVNRTEVHVVDEIKLAGQ